jgi:RND family efflux transporter MFP subunit
MMAAAADRSTGLLENGGAKGEGPSCAALLAMLLVVHGCGASDGVEAPASSGPAGGARKGPEPAAVETVPAEAPRLVRERRLLGRAEAPLSATLAAGVSGTLVTVGPREGDAVKAGEVIATLDAALVTPRLKAARAEVARVAAELRLARAELGRVKVLSTDSGASSAVSPVTPAERERYEARAAALEAGSQRAAADVETLVAELARHTVTAPFDGIVAARHLDPGSWAGAGAPLMTLIGAGPVEVFVDVPLADAGGLAVGGEVGLTLSLAQTEGARATLKGVIRGLIPALDAVTQGVRLRIAPASAPAGDALLPGAPVDVLLSSVLEAKGAVKVPNDAVKRGPGRAWVFVVPGGDPPVPRRVDMEVLGRDATHALVRGEGLAEGDTVITRGNERLRPGQPVRPGTPAAPPEPRKASP